MREGQQHKKGKRGGRKRYQRSGGPRQVVFLKKRGRKIFKKRGHVAIPREGEISCNHGRAREWPPPGE